MTHPLKYDPGVEAAHDSLPQGAREQLTLALADACEDPISATEPYGEEDDFVRMIITDHVSVLLFIGHNLKSLTVLEIKPLG